MKACGGSEPDCDRGIALDTFLKFRDEKLRRRSFAATSTRKLPLRPEFVGTAAETAPASSGPHWEQGIVPEEPAAEPVIQPSFESP